MIRDLGHPHSEVVREASHKMRSEGLSQAHRCSSQKRRCQPQVRRRQANTNLQMPAFFWLAMCIQSNMDLSVQTPSSTVWTGAKNMLREIVSCGQYRSKTGISVSGTLVCNAHLKG